MVECGNMTNEIVALPGIRSKLRKVFSFSLKERLSIVSSKKDRVQDRPGDFSNYFTSSKLSATESKLPKAGDQQTNSAHSITRPLEVPK